MISYQAPPLLLRRIISASYRHGGYLALLLGCAASVYAADGNDSYSFDTLLLRGSVLNNTELNQFNQTDTIAPGTYQLDIYINGEFIERSKMDFVRADNKQVSPCFDHEQLMRFGLKEVPDQAADNGSCLQFGRDIKDVTANANISQLRLDLSIPHALLNKKPRGSINPESLDSGETMLFANYNLNQYHVSYREGQTNNMNSTYLNLNGGMNIGLWRYRQQSSYRYDKNYGSNWNTSRRYVQRAIFPLRSEVLLGEGFTEGRFFSGLGFRGVKLSSDDRMLPDSMRGYAPVVRGVAKSNAVVRVMQGKSTLYETTVAPGPFAINDLYATNYAGDLTVVVTEADGSVSSFTVPFSAVPESIRPGLSRYSATVGHSRYVGDNDLFSEVIWQYGLNNSMTLNAGNQFADGYQSVMLGGVYSNWLGAFGMDTTYSNASLPDGDVQGWMLHLAYSRTFSPTNTTLSIAGYRYSTDGYRDLSDVLGVRNAHNSDDTWSSYTYRQRSRFEVAVNQGLGDFGNLTVSGSTQDYRDGRSRDNQLQFGWGKTFGNGVMINLTVTQTRSMGSSYRDDDNNKPYYNDGAYDDVYNTPSNRDSQTTAALSFTFPLGSSSSAPNVSFLANHSQGSTYQSTLSGSVGEKTPVSYGLNYTTDDTDKQNIWGGNLQSRLPYANVTGSVSSSNQYWQGSASVQGAAVIHRGGVTLGPYVGDTFALIDANGANGAQVLDGQGSRVDYFGYALAPALIPYHYNSVALNPEGMNDKAELTDGQQRVAPYAGATVRLKYNTVRGQALLITALRPNNEAIPMGSDVLDADGNNVGMVGQANQIYLRDDAPEGDLTVSWGKKPEQSCRIHYKIEPNKDAPIQRLSAPCN
ncbi:MAG: fimbrial biogenesis outer membrane usher protein [Enterobacteriaceae bacterium]|jgi:outer membrane usher protein|nr:fimbrial biogenesis outer membrane usher protein [Enterobacteriaceae bacterium]